MGAAEKLLVEALALPVGDRAKLVAELAASLPNEGADSGYYGAWAEVITERVDHVLAGTAEYEDEPWEDAHARIAARLAERHKRA